MTTKTALAVLVALLSLSTACIPPRYASNSYTNYQADAEAKYRAENGAFISAVEQGRVPKDCNKKIDKWMIDNLKDPDSRKVEFGKNTQVVACGSVNAKNSYGGYTGKKPFTAWFTSTGDLADLMTWDEKDLSTWKSASSPDELGFKYHWLMAACGYIDSPVAASIEERAGRDPKCMYSADGVLIKCAK